MKKKRKAPESEKDWELHLSRFKAQKELLIQAYYKIHHTLDTLQKTEDKLIASEKLALLGQQVAVVGHEINSPLSAISSAQTVIKSRNKLLHRQALQLGKELNNEQVQLLDDLLDRVVKATAISEENSMRYERLSKKLDSWSIDHSDQLSDKLIKLGLDDSIDEFYPLLKLSRASSILDYCYQYKILEHSCYIIEECSAKASKVVKTLKDHSYDNKGETQDISLMESLESVLALHKATLVDVEVERRFEKTPQINVDPDKMTQVWINLINNSVEASGGKGKLELGVYETKDHIIAYIKDRAGGMSKEVQEKLFEPFFTTKPKGKGTGIGLSIVKRIIEEQGGQIEFEVDKGIGTKAIIKFRKP